MPRRVATLGGATPRRIRRVAQQRDPAVAVAGVAVGMEREEVGGGVPHGSARERDDAVDLGVGIRDERVAEPHEQRRDASVVARARGLQHGIDVGVQEQLGHRETTRARAGRRHGVVEVDDREPRDIGQEPVRRCQPFEQLPGVRGGPTAGRGPTAATRTTSGSPSSAAMCRSGPLADGSRTRPSVSTSRERASGSRTPSSAPSTPTTSGSATTPDHCSSVLASMPATPSTTIPSSRPTAENLGSPDPSAHAACSRRNSRSSESSCEHAARLVVEHAGERVRRGDRQ